MHHKKSLPSVQVLYALTAGIAGYVAAVTYKILGGTSWVRNTLLTATLFCGPLLVTFSFLNTVAIIYRSTAALPFGTIVIIFILWAVVTFPLTVLGGIAGKNTKVCAVQISESIGKKLQALSLLPMLRLPCRAVVKTARNRGRMLIWHLTRASSEQVYHLNQPLKF